jgi:hypothetical protein
VVVLISGEVLMLPQRADEAPAAVEALAEETLLQLPLVATA